MLRCDLTSATSTAATLAVIGDYATSHPELPWILGGGWSMAAFLGGTPTAAALDAVVRDRPVFLPNRDHHSAWVNTKALELAGITGSTADPVDGRVERDRAGAPTGTLHEGAMDLVGRLAPELSEDEMLAALALAQRHLHALGITGWQDAIIGSYAGLQDSSHTYQRAERSGELTARVVGALWWERERGVEQIPELVERRASLLGEKFRATSVKIMQDGVVESGTAAMLDPYLDDEARSTSHSGTSFVDPSALRGYVTALDAEGFQVHIHAIGDRAVREALDALEAARDSNGPNDHRHHLAHIEVIHPADLPRFRELGVVANMQPLWAGYEPQMTEFTIPRLGQERAALLYPFGDLVARGTCLAGGSDWPVTSADPLQGIHVAVNRTLPGSDLEPFLPHQGLDLATALTAYTAGSAYVNHLDQTGTIKAGQLADLVVLDRDPFRAPKTEICDARVLATYVAGRQVYAT